MGSQFGTETAATFQEYEEASLLWEQGIATHKRYPLCSQTDDWAWWDGKEVCPGKETWLGLLQWGCSEVDGAPYVANLAFLNYQNWQTTWPSTSSKEGVDEVKPWMTTSPERLRHIHVPNSLWLECSKPMARTLPAGRALRHDLAQGLCHGAMDLPQRKPLLFLKETKKLPPTKLPEKKIRVIHGLEPHRVSNQSTSQTRAQGRGIHGGATDSWSHCSWRTDDADWTLEAPEILPDMIQGWYLLGDSGLDTGERNMILAALKQDFSFDRVALELRNQWPDEDLRRRDLNNRQSGWWVEEEQLSGWRRTSLGLHWRPEWWRKSTSGRSPRRGRKGLSRRPCWTPHPPRGKREAAPGENVSQILQAQLQNIVQRRWQRLPIERQQHMPTLWRRPSHCQLSEADRG